MTIQKITREIIFDENTDISKEIKKFESEGWEIVATEPIEKIEVKIIGRRFVLEKKKEYNCKRRI